MVKCSAYRCPNTHFTKTPGLKFHRFPKDESIRNEWLKNMKRLDWKPDSQSVLCSKHFEKHFYSSHTYRIRLNPGAVPTLFDELPPSTEIKSTPEMRSGECRSCLRLLANESCHSLFETWVTPWAVRGARIADDLARFADIEISETDEFSKMICMDCYKRLSDAFLFMIMVQKNDNLLRNTMRAGSIHNGTEAALSWPKPIQLNKNDISTVNQIDVEVKQEALSEDDGQAEQDLAMPTDQSWEPTMDIKIEPEEIIAPVDSLNGLHNNTEDCPDSQVSVTIKPEPSSGDESNEETLDLPLDCLLCSKVFHSVSGLKAHVIVEHSYQGVKRTADRGTSPLPPPAWEPEPSHTDHTMSCQTCKQSFATHTDLMVHKVSHSEHVCYVCDAKFSTFQQLSRHGARCRRKRPGDTLADRRSPPPRPQQLSQTFKNQALEKSNANTTMNTKKENIITQETNVKRKNNLSVSVKIERDNRNVEIRNRNYENKEIKAKTNSLSGINKRLESIVKKGLKVHKNPGISPGSKSLFTVVECQKLDKCDVNENCTIENSILPDNYCEQSSNGTLSVDILKNNSILNTEAKNNHKENQSDDVRDKENSVHEEDTVESIEEAEHILPDYVPNSTPDASNNGINEFNIAISNAKTIRNTNRSKSLERNSESPTILSFENLVPEDSNLIANSSTITIGKEYATECVSDKNSGNNNSNVDHIATDQIISEVASDLEQTDINKAVSATDDLDATKKIDKMNKMEVHLAINPLTSAGDETTDVDSDTGTCESDVDNEVNVKVK